MSNAVKISSADFERLVLKATQPVMVDFFATWCQPCKLIAPELDAIAQANEGKALVYKIDVDENRELAKQYGIMSIPCVMLFVNGEVAERSEGAVRRNVLQGLIDKHI
ncbi:MAG: thioredoxin [Clostridia bacterium]|nr:thioredoxin [Clostridia bacterium]